MSADGPEGANQAFVRALIPAAIFAGLIDVAGVIAFLYFDNWVVMLPCLLISPIPLTVVVIRRTMQLRRTMASAPPPAKPAPSEPPQPPIVQ